MLEHRFNLQDRNKTEIKSKWLTYSTYSINPGSVLLKFYNLNSIDFTFPDHIDLTGSILVIYKIAALSGSYKSESR